jgi:glucose-1-phosphate thymidylyltransferase
VRPSRRTETEIVDVIAEYLKRGTLRTEILGRGMAWLDTGTPESLQEASSYIEAIEKRQGLKVACPEEIAYRLGYIDADQLNVLAAAAGESAYAEYLKHLLRDVRR